MSEEYFIRLMCRTQWRDEGDLTPPNLTQQEREWWHKEAAKIEQEEAQSA